MIERTTRIRFAGEETGESVPVTRRAQVVVSVAFLACCASVLAASLGATDAEETRRWWDPAGRAWTVGPFDVPRLLLIAIASVVGAAIAARGGGAGPITHRALAVTHAIALVNAFDLLRRLGARNGDLDDGWIGPGAVGVAFLGGALGLGAALLSRTVAARDGWYSRRPHEAPRRLGIVIASIAVAAIGAFAGAVIAYAPSGWAHMGALATVAVLLLFGAAEVERRRLAPVPAIAVLAIAAALTVGVRLCFIWGETLVHHGVLAYSEFLDAVRECARDQGGLVVREIAIACVAIVSGRVPRPIGALGVGAGFATGTAIAWLGLFQAFEPADDRVSVVRTLVGAAIVGVTFVSAESIAVELARRFPQSSET